jgi:hypothetical protein
MSVKLKIDRRVEVAPGIINFDLTVSKSKPGAMKPKIDKAFAKLFADRVRQEAAKKRLGESR